MKDIARDLGVSPMTVSKALRHHSDISEATRNRVLKRAQQLGYQPNWVARSLVTRRTYMVGLIIPDLMHSFFAEVAKGVARRFEPLGYQIVISNTEENPQAEEQQIQALLARNVDGLIIASSHLSGRAKLFRMLRSRKIPFVLLDRLPPGIEAHYVGARDEEIGALATEHLIEQGCRRIAHLRGPGISTGIGRVRGYRQTLLQHGLPVRSDYLLDGHFDDVSGYEAMKRLLRLDEPPDGVFCFNDPVAAGAVRAVLEAGLNVPRDVAIVGVGNVHYSDLLQVPLTTVDQSSSRLGESSAELLARCIESKAPLRPEAIILRPTLIVRQSSLRR